MKKSLVFSKLTYFDESYFGKLDDIDNYFKIDNDYFIGKFSKTGIRRDENKKLIPYSFVGPESIFNTKLSILKRSGTIRYKPLNISNRSSIKNDKESHKNSLSKVYNNVDNFEVGRMYDKIKSRVNKSNINEFINNVPISIKKNLKIQENSLLTAKKYENIHKNVFNYICKKTKKNEDSLVINSSLNYRVNKEIKEIEENRHLNRTGNFKWIISLRAGKNLNKNHFSFLNVGKDSNPICAWINEKDIQTPEFINSPFKTNYIMKKDNETKKLSFTSHQINRDLKIEGKNLIEEELCQIKKIKGRKYWSENNYEESNEDIIFKNYK